MGQSQSLESQSALEFNFLSKQTCLPAICCNDLAMMAVIDPLQMEEHGKTARSSASEPGTANAVRSI